MSSTKSDSKLDVALVGPMKDGKALAVRIREDGDGAIQVTQGKLRPMKDGETTFGEIVTLKSDKEHAPFYTVNTVAPPPVETAYRHKSRSGPAMVNSPAYQAGWERIFVKNPDDLSD